MLKIYCLVFLVVFQQTSFAVDFTLLNLPETTKRTLNSQWGLQDESTTERALKFPFRLLGRPIKRLLHGKIGQGVTTTLALPYNLVHANKQKTDELYKSSLGTVLTPLSFVSETISDLGAATKSIKYAGLRTTSRIQVCASKFPLLPMEHIFFTVDHGEIHNNNFDIEKSQKMDLDPARNFGADSYCFKVPLKDKQSASLAIERLSCLSTVDPAVDYKLLSYNCGGMTREYLHEAGLSFPDISNLGIGSSGNNKSIPESVIKSFAARRIDCNSYIEDLRNLIFDLEKGELVDPSRMNRILNFGPRKDAILQLILSAQRGQNENNVRALYNDLTSIRKRHSFFIAGVIELFDSSILIQQLNHYLLPDESISGTFDSNSKRVHKMFRKTLKSMFNELSVKDLEKIEDLYPTIKEITNDLKKPYVF